MMDARNLLSQSPCALVLFALGSFAWMPALAQNKYVTLSLPQWELGEQSAYDRIGCYATGSCYVPSYLIGPAASFNINRNLAIDSQFLITPTSSQTTTDLAGGRNSEFLIGPRLETRSNHYGLFLEAKFGDQRWSRIITSGQVISNQIQFTFGSYTEMLAQIGGGFEVSPTSYLHIRGDVASEPTITTDGYFSNHFHAGVGVYTGLGRRLHWQSLQYDPNRDHRFLSPTNITLITLNELASTADAVTTQIDMKQGGSEGDPLVAPLAKYGWSGLIGAMGLEFGALTVGMYAMHRLNHHIIERIPPIGGALIHTIFAYGNSRGAR